MHMATRSRKGYWRMSQNDLSLVILRPQFWNPTAEFMASPPEPVFHREGLGGGFGLCVVGIRPIVIDMTDPAAKGIGQNASCVLRMVSIRMAGECDEIVTVHVRC
jgi:hypothetical protein